LYLSQKQSGWDISISTLQDHRNSMYSVAQRPVFFGLVVFCDFPQMGRQGLKRDFAAYQIRGLKKGIPWAAQENWAHATGC
jgi:hypothetical protein